MPLLVDLEDELAEDIKLRDLAAKLGTSQFHFHRVFTDAVGETPKKHVERVRLERAAMRLAVSDDPVLDIGLGVGFKNAETFARRFKRFLGYTPSAYRRMAKAAQAQRLASVDFFDNVEYTLAPARFERLPRMRLLAARHVGSYGDLHDTYAGPRSPWSSLARWARARELAVMPLRISIVYDDPTLTPPASQRADLCVPVEGRVPAADGVRWVDFAGGMYGLIEFTGRKDHIINAFRGLADEIRRSPRFDFADGPPLEIVRETDIGRTKGVHRIDACFPVARKRKPSVPSKGRSKNRQAQGQLRD